MRNAGHNVTRSMIIELVWNLTFDTTTNVVDVYINYQQLGTAGTGDPIQLGAGVQVGATPSLFTQGSVSATGVATDVAVQGSGFFCRARFQRSDPLHARGRFHPTQQLPRYHQRRAGSGLSGRQWRYQQRRRSHSVAARSGDHQSAVQHYKRPTDNQSRRVRQRRRQVLHTYYGLRFARRKTRALV